MGRTVVVLEHKEVPEHGLNKRFTCELCEDIHIHYRNLRLEFNKDEFIYILNLLKQINVDEVNNFHYSDWAYKELIVDFNLPKETVYNNRLQIELQKEGHSHIHYKNLRIEMKNLTELGYPNFYGWTKILKWKFMQKIKKINKNIICYFHRKKSTEKLLRKYNLDETFFQRDLARKTYIYAKEVNIPIRKLFCILAVKEGTHVYKLGETPADKYLQGNKQVLYDYFEFKNKKQGTFYSVSKFDDLLEKNMSSIQSAIVINENNQILDGYLRVAILRHRFGKNKKISVLKLYGVE